MKAAYVQSERVQGERVPDEKRTGDDSPKLIGRRSRRDWQGLGLLRDKPQLKHPQGAGPCCEKPSYMGCKGQQTGGEAIRKGKLY